MKELLRTEKLPQSAFTPQEEQMMYFFMLSDLRRGSYPVFGLKENDYYGYLSDEKKQKIVASLTEEQKAVIRRDYLYKKLTNGVTTVTSVHGGMLQAFAKQHLPEQSAGVETTYKDDYGKKNARLDERIAGLKKAEKKAKAEAKSGKADQPAPAPATKPEEVKQEPTATVTADAKKSTADPLTDKVLIVTVPKRQTKAVPVAQ